MIFSKDEIIKMVVTNKIPMGMKLDIIAWFDPTRGMLKQSRTGSHRSVSGVYIKEGFVSRTPSGFIEACNVVIRAWNNCKMLSGLNEDKSVMLNSRGTLLNRNCSKRTDAVLFSNLFNYYFKIFFKNEISNCLKETKGNKDETKSTKQN